MNSLKHPRDEAQPGCQQWHDVEDFRLATLHDLNDMVCCVARAVEEKGGMAPNADIPPLALNAPAFTGDIDDLDARVHVLRPQVQQLAASLRSSGRLRDAQQFHYLPSVADVLDEGARSMKLSDDSFR